MNSKFLKDFILYGGAIGISRMLPILLLPLYLTVLTIDEFGRIDILLSFQAFIIIFGSLQLETAFQRYVNKVDSKFNYALSISAITTIISFLVFIIVSVFSASISNYFFDSDVEVLNIKVVTLSTVFFNLSTVILIYFRYTNREKTSAFLTILQVLITSLLTYYFVIINSFGSFGYVMAINLGWLSLLIISIYIIRDELSSGFRWQSLTKSLKFAIPQLPARFASFFMQFGSKFIILAYFGVSAVALQGVAIKFAAPFQLIYVAFTMAWYPFIYKNEKSIELEKKIDLILKAAILIVLFSSVLIHFTGGLVIDYMFSAEYYKVKSIIYITILPYGMLIIKEILECGIRFSGKTYATSISYLAGSTITLILLLSSKNIEDALRATVIGSVVLILITLLFSERLYSLRFSKLTVFSFLIVSYLLAIYIG